MKNEVIIATIKAESIDVLPAHELAISAACTYFGITREELFATSNMPEPARRKRTVFYIMKYECQLTPPMIADICHTTRQNIDQHIYKAGKEIKVYLQSACDYRNITSIYSDLLKKQDECLKQLLPRSNSTP